MAAIRGRTLLGGTVLESWLRLCLSHPSSVAPSSSSWFISSLLGCRPSGVSVPGILVSRLAYVCGVCLYRLLGCIFWLLYNIKRAAGRPFLVN